MSHSADSAGTASHLRPEDLLEHAGWVHGLAYALVRDVAAADDLVQEAWLAALRKPPAADRPVRPWLAGVVRNLARQRWRGESRRARREEVAATRRAAEPLPTPDELAERLETQRRLEAVVAELPEPLKATVLLRYFEGLSAAAIARREGIPAGTVRWRLSRALDVLRERLDDDHDGDRRAWALAMVPIAAHGAPPPASGGPTGRTWAAAAALLQGVVAMSVATKVAIGGGVVLLLAVLAMTGAALLPRAEERAPDEPVAVEFREAQATKPARLRVASVPRADADDPSTDDRDPDDAAVPRTLLEGRVLDELLRPVADAWVQVDGGDAFEPGPDGRFRIPVELPEPQDVAQLLFGAPAHAIHAQELLVRRGVTNHVGDVVLEAGGSIAGRIVDADGEPLPNAWVGLADDEAASGSYATSRRMRRWGLHGAVVVESDGQGRFSLPGVPVGRRRVWAGAEDHLSTLSGPIEVRAGRESYGVELVVEPYGERDLITGRVVSPDGEPVARADLRYEYSGSFGRSGSGTFNAERDGTFRFVVPYEGTYRFTAKDADGAFGAAVAAEVEPGTRDLVLRLVAVEHVTLRVSDVAGTPVTRFSVSVQDPKLPALYGYLAEAVRADGVVEVQRPAARFWVQVDAPGYELGTIGPLEPDQVPAELSVELRRLPGVRGRVTEGAGGSPVEGARVALHPAVPSGELWIHNGFPTRWEATPAAATTTDENGAYDLTVRESGTYVVRVVMAGAAPAESSPLHIDPTEGRDGVDLALTSGGILEGVVRTADGRSPAGTIIGISRGDGFPRTTRVGPDGGYRFDNLTPGPWTVRVVDEELRPGNHSTTMTRGSFALDPSCEVVEGQVTTYDIGSRTTVGHALSITVTIDGEAAADWRAMLIDHDAGTVARVGAEESSDVLDGDGRARLTASGAGPYRLIVSAPLTRMILMREITLAEGESSWRADVRTGALRGSGAPVSDPDDPRPPLALVCEVAGGAVALVPLPSDETGTFATDLAPAGECRIAHLSPDDPNPLGWEVVTRVHVTAGEETTLDLDAR